jgi:Leucine-rich repeat (LRR) protein
MQLVRLPEDIGALSQLRELNLENCKRLRQLPPSFGGLSELSILDVSGCAELRDLPPDLGRLKCLEVLDVSGCRRLRKLPHLGETLSQLTALMELDISGSGWERDAAGESSEVLFGRNGC